MGEACKNLGTYGGCVGLHSGLEFRGLDIENDLSSPIDPMIRLPHFEVLNQETSWMVGGVDVFERFRTFFLENAEESALARDGVADLTPGSMFVESLPPHIAMVVNIPKSASIDIYQKWPTLGSILERVFKSSDYDGIALAVKKEDMTDPLAFYMASVIMS